MSETTATNGVKPKSRKELLRDKEFEEALKETLKEEKPIALTSNDFNVFLLFAVSTAVTVVAYFADKWHLRTRNDIIMLLGLGVALFVGLRDSYTRQAKIALNRFNDVDLVRRLAHPVKVKRGLEYNGRKGMSE